MTTIAWDGKTLAGDRQATLRDTYFDKQKVFKLSDYILFGASGNVEDGIIAREWIYNTLTPEKPNYTPESISYLVERPKLDDSFSAIVVIQGHEGKSVAYLVSNKLMFTVLKDKWAIGSGMDFAIGAMNNFASAYGAVQTASLFDVWTNSYIDEVNFKPAYVAVPPTTVVEADAKDDLPF